MGTTYGSKWKILTDTLRVTPNYTPRVLLQIESAGYDDTAAYRNQRIFIDGTQVLSIQTPRSYAMTRLIYQNKWTFSSCQTFDVYGGAANAQSALDFLLTFNNNDMLILTTNDEPFNNRSTFKSELINSFKAQLQDSSVWAFRCSYQLVATKSRGAIYEAIKPRFSATGINTTMYLG